MKLLAAALVVVAAGCSRSLLLGAHATDGGSNADLAAASDLALASGDGAVGPHWSQVVSPTTQTLRTIWVGPSGGWAAGDGGAIIHFDGQMWTALAGGVPDSTYSFDGMWSDGSAAYVVGEHAGAGVGFAWNGTSWTNLTAAWALPVRAIWASSASDVWSVTDGGYAFHSINGVWSSSTVAAGVNLTGVAGSPGVPGSVRVAGAQAVYAFDGVAWNSVVASPPPTALSGGVSADGALWVTSQSGEIYTTSAGAWSAPHPTGATQALHAIWRGAIIVAVGDAGSVIMGDGAAAWTVASLGTGALYGVYGTSASDVWAVGAGGAIWHYAP